MGYTEQFSILMNQLNKSIDNANKLDYFKNALLKILDSKENQEERLSKSIQNYFNSINTTLYGISIEKGKAGTIGEIRTWKDGKKYKKMPNGKWVRVYQEHNRSAEISIARLKGKVRNAQSVDELMNIVMANIHRFEDENGQVLPIVEELKKEVAASKGRINQGKPSTQQQIEKFKKENTKIEKTKKSASKNEKLKISLFPESFLKGGWKKEFSSMVDFINENENANPKVVSLFRNIGNIKFNEPFSVKKLPKKASEAGLFNISVYRSSGVPAESALMLRKGGVEESKKGFLLPIMMHEMGHFFDFALRPDPTKVSGISTVDENYLKEIENCSFSEDELQSIKDEMLEKASKFKSSTYKANSVCREVRQLNKEVDSYIKDGKYSEYETKYNDLLNEYNQYMKEADEAHADYIGNEMLVDIYDALSDGELFGTGIGGHGKSYYRSNGKYKTPVQLKGEEIFANYISLSIYGNEQVERLKKRFPKLVETLDGILDKAVNKIGAE